MNWASGKGRIRKPFISQLSFLFLARIFIYFQKLADSLPYVTVRRSPENDVSQLFRGIPREKNLKNRKKLKKTV
jgi:hypothetical protein